MKLTKQSSIAGAERDPNKFKNLVRAFDNDLKNIVFALNGRIRFGGGGDGDRGENIAGEFQEFTTSATPDAENTLAHGLGSIPIGYLILGQDKAGSLYQLDDTGTAWTATNIYLKCDVASVTFLVFLLK